MDKQTKRISNLFIRYVVLLLIGINLSFFYKLLTPVTIKTVAWVLSVFSPVTVADHMIRFRGIIIAIVPGCVAVAALFLLVVLIFSSAEIKPKVRAMMSIIAVISFFIFNIIRIIVLSGLSRTNYFQEAHWVAWHLLSTLIVVGIWFGLVKLYKVKSIPVYTDIMYLKGLIKPAKKSKKKSKKKKR